MRLRFVSLPFFSHPLLRRYSLAEPRNPPVSCRLQKRKPPLVINRQQPCLPGASELSLSHSTLQSSSASQPQKSPNSNPITHLQTSTTQSLRYKKKLNPIQPLRSRRHLPPPIAAVAAATTAPSLQRPDRKDAAVEVHHDLPLVDALQTDVRVTRAHLAQALVARGEDAAEGAGAGAGAAQRGEGGGGGGG